MRVIDETTSKMHFDPKAKPKGMLRIVLAMKNSVRAISWLVKNETAFRQELILLILAACILVNSLYGKGDFTFLHTLRFVR